MNTIKTTATATTATTFSATDEAFFRITGSLFPPSFSFGAGVLLATYDDEDEPPVATPRATATGSAPALTHASA